MTLKTFIYNDELYIRLVPSKRMFQSTLIHQVVNRGDIFAMRVSDQQFTVIPGKAQVTHTQHKLIDAIESGTQDALPGM